MAPATFAVLLALLPATAAAMGAVVLHQWPHPLDVVGLVLVSAAIAVTSRHRPEPVTEPDAGP
jgi:inner membrane transporter RhtA